MRGNAGIFRVREFRGNIRRDCRRGRGGGRGGFRRRYGRRVYTTALFHVVVTHVNYPTSTCT